MSAVVSGYYNGLSPSPAPIPPAVFVDAQDLNVILNPVSSDYVGSCGTGCRVRTPSPTSTGIGYYATANDAYFSTPPPGSSPTRGPWGTFFDRYFDGTNRPGTTLAQYTAYSNDFGCIYVMFNTANCAAGGGVLWGQTAFYAMGNPTPFPTAVKFTNLDAIGVQNGIQSGVQCAHLYGTHCRLRIVTTTPTGSTVADCQSPPNAFGSCGMGLGTYAWGSIYDFFQFNTGYVPPALTLPSAGSTTYTFQSWSTIDWEQVTIQTEVPPFASQDMITPVPSPPPALNLGQSYTLGYLDQPYMPMGLIFWYDKKVYAWPGAAGGTYVQCSPPNTPDPSCGGCQLPYPGPWFYYDASAHVSSPTCGRNRYGAGSGSGLLIMTFDYPVVYDTSVYLNLPGLARYSVPDCSGCEQPGTTSYAWDLQMYPPVGNTWPGSVSGTLPTISNIVLYNMGGGSDANFNVAGISGAVYLNYLGINSAYWRYFAKQTASFSAARMYDTSQTPGTSTRLNCVAITPGPVSGAIAYPCEQTIPYLCQYDITPYVAQSGRRGDICGPSSRAGGLAEPGVTCFDQFPEANATLNPLGAEAYAAYLSGTLNLFLVRLGVDYDALRDIYTKNPGMWWRFPDAYARWAASFSSEPGATSVGVTPDPYNWVNYDLSSAYGICCGHQVDQTTGLVGLYVAGATEWCDPNLSPPPPPPDPFLVSELPTVLQPIDNTTDPRFVSTCGLLAKPAVYYQQDTFGGPTPDFATLFTIVDAAPLHLTVTALLPAFPIFNTGKNLPGMYIFFNNVSATVSGFVSVDCFACTSNPVVSVWIAPISTDYSYPSVKITLGSFSVPPGIGLVPYTFVLGASPPASSIVSGVYYQVVGWDFSGLVAGASITLQNGIITDPLIVDQCRHFRGKMPKYKPKPVVRANVPINDCVLSVQDELYFGTARVGECHCDPDYGGGGASCASPVVNTRYGRLVCAGLGDGGTTALTPARTLAPTGTAFPSDEEGVFYYSLAGQAKVRAGCKPLDVGRVLRTRLIPESAFSYPTIYLSISSFDQSFYVNATTNLLQWMAYGVAQAVVAGYSADIASFVTGSEVADYLGLAVPAALPLFLGLAQNNASASGNYDWAWTDRGFPFFPVTCLQGPVYCPTAIGHCDSPDTCGRPLPSPVSGCGAADPPSSSPTVAPSFAPTTWTVNLCAAINFNNVYYLGGGNGFVTDGNFIPVSIYGVVPGTIALPLYSGDIYVYVYSTGLVSLSLSNSAATTSCVPAAPRNAILGLDVFLCQGGTPSPGSTAIYYAATVGGETLTEVQAFGILDTSRASVYPYR
jgi:hypothetical protein